MSAEAETAPRARPPKPPAEVEVTVDSMAHGGAGVARLDALSPPELRAVRDHERRNANRKTVLAAIERKLP